MPRSVVTLYFRRLQSHTGGAQHAGQVSSVLETSSSPWASTSRGCNEVPMVGVVPHTFLDTDFKSRTEVVYVVGTRDLGVENQSKSFGQFH